jgi:hypothetical protein
MKEDDWNDVDSGWEEMEDVIDSDQEPCRPPKPSRSASGSLSALAGPAPKEPQPPTPEGPLAEVDSEEFSEDGDTVPSRSASGSLSALAGPAPKEPQPPTPEEPLAEVDSEEFSEDGDTVDYTEEEVPEEVVAFLGHKPEPAPEPKEEPAPQVVLSMQDLAEDAQSSQTDEEPPTVPGGDPLEADQSLLELAETAALPSQTDEEPPTVPGNPFDAGPSSAVARLTPAQVQEDQTAPCPSESPPEAPAQDWTGLDDAVTSDTQSPVELPQVSGEGPGYSMVVLGLLALAALVSVAAVVYFVCC